MCPISRITAPLSIGTKFPRVRLEELTVRVTGSAMFKQYTYEVWLIKSLIKI